MNKGLLCMYSESAEGVSRQGEKVEIARVAALLGIRVLLVLRVSDTPIGVGQGFCERPFLGGVGHDPILRARPAELPAFDVGVSGAVIRGGVREDLEEDSEAQSL